MIFQVIVAIGYTSVLTWAIGLYEGVDTRPYHIQMCALAFAVAGALAFGVGLLRVLMATFLPALHKVYSILTRAMIFISGIFFVPSFMPPHLREWLWLNPVLHNVELLRLGYYDQYPTTMMSPTYLAAWILIPTAFGMVGLWVNRRIYLG